MTASGRWRGADGSPEIYVDGGIRRRTVPEIARADGVVPCTEVPLLVEGIIRHAHRTPP